MTISNHDEDPNAELISQKLGISDERVNELCLLAENSFHKNKHRIGPTLKDICDSLDKKEEIVFTSFQLGMNTMKAFPDYLHGEELKR